MYCSRPQQCSNPQCHCAVHQSDGRARKRRRASSDPNYSVLRRAALPDPTVPLNVTHDPEFWFEDGSVVLIAYNIGFRVYKRLLVEHSPFFRDLFQIPQPARIPKIEGCPVVVLLDPPERLRHLLRVLYPINGQLSFGKRHAPVSMDAVSAIVLLSHKYQMDQLLAQALSILMEHYTDDFNEWAKPKRKTPLGASALDAISAINIARLTNTPSILPLAFLELSRAGAGVLRGCLRDFSWTEGLTIEDVERVMDGRAAFLKASSKALARIFRPTVSFDCLRSSQCLRVLASKASGLDDQLEMMYQTDAICNWANEFNGVDIETGLKLCDSCREMIAERELEERKDLWSDLPDFFDLTVEGWSVD
ncbi:hypothetical protein BV20DRAFT_57181 [Pilatotrama ljubarskyi]|nr:hypothetical protein BV20DRAFT_57181 [Pilatotrama ljubarskyi]